MYICVYREYFDCLECKKFGTCLRLVAPYYLASCVEASIAASSQSTLYTKAYSSCLLYTSDAADEEDSVDLGGRRIIKKKKKNRMRTSEHTDSVPDKIIHGKYEHEN
eukprot:TRINITY_DN63825_c0_g1_i3.p1 TRINITY_DN63825_c0_g1~~TRINITY_DN63825_c0_g1_i3.p1  ORF type:complete len:107 (+),score=20.65 TRINITY_DN63825_c0_g1_i3:184-504(+)